MSAFQTLACLPPSASYLVLAGGLTPQAAGQLLPLAIPSCREHGKNKTFHPRHRFCRALSIPFRFQDGEPKIGCCSPESEMKQIGTQARITRGQGFCMSEFPTLSTIATQRSLDARKIQMLMMLYETFPTN